MPPHAPRRTPALLLLLALLGVSLLLALLAPGCRAQGCPAGQVREFTLCSNAAGLKMAGCGQAVGGSDQLNATYYGCLCGGLFVFFHVPVHVWG